MRTTEQKILRFMNPDTRKTSEFSHFLGTLPRISCRDGFSLSCQAGYGLYCSPRDNVGDWHQIEIGFPSAKEELLMGYAEDKGRPTETVYGYVPLKVVGQVIEKHGGSEQLDLMDNA